MKRIRPEPLPEYAKRVEMLQREPPIAGEQEALIAKVIAETLS
jgi:hypothetical protein